ncbi:TIGR03905 family protein [Oribacterium sp. C9]|uniref:TIGR03905 family TSCPD domain-containing protein n=1 Tax=Oribacterium sp. C9 TaxID=1943579 RepID=UPI00098E9EBA|nr:TIGR03905 family TSCPD domain-containing protein [Oribacterium sp. C9]OON86696.1 TIGR03905 family protein [Oribacterium sp. C9]
MQNYSMRTSGVCARQVDFSIEDGKLHDVHFYGGCAGNTLAISKLLEGYDAKKAVEILKGNLCGSKGTSCADQLARGVEQALAENIM